MTSRRGVASVVAALAMCLPCGARHLSAQEPVLQPGARVRVAVPCEAAALPAARSSSGECSFEGEAVRIRDATLELALGDSTVRLDLGSVRRLEVSEGSRSHRLLGAGAGLVIGGIATYFILEQGGSTSLCDRSANQDALSRSECFGLTVLGGLAGAGLGAIAGGFVRSERWRDVPLDRLRVGWIPGSGGRVRISLTFGAWAPTFP